MVIAEPDYMPRKPIKPSELMTQLNIRVPPDLMADLRDGHRALSLLARSNAEDAPDLSKSMRRLWRLGLDVVFAKVGGRPQSEADWQALEATLLSKKSH